MGTFRLMEAGKVDGIGGAEYRNARGHWDCEQSPKTYLDEWVESV